MFNALMPFVTLIRGIYSRYKEIGGSDVTNLVDAAKSGNRRDTLIAMRDILAKTIQECDSGRDMASNTKRLMEVMNEIEQIDQEIAEKEAQEKQKQKVSKHDRLKRKHENG